MNLRIITVDAYSKQEAIAKLPEYGFNMEVKYNSTIAYKEAVINPEFNTTEFAQGQIAKKARGAANVGFMVVVKPGQPETRTRLYEVENVVTTGPRHYLLKYEVVDEKSRVYDTKDTKAEALVSAKQLVNQLKVDLSIRLVKHPEENGIAAIVKYAPSENLKEGSYMFFGNISED